MISGLRALTRRGVFNPISRAAIIAWAWGYRHEVLRWGRSLWNEVVGRDDGVDAGRAVRTGRVLVAIAIEEELRNAPELKQVTMNGDVVDLKVKAGWRQLPLLVEKVQRVKGITGVTVNGTEVASVSAR